MTPITVTLVTMDARPGVWCDVCALPSAITVTYAIGLHLVEFTVCNDCGSW